MKLKESRNLTCTCYKLRLFSLFSSIYPTAYIKRDNDDEASIKLYIYINHKISIQEKHASKWRNINDSQMSFCVRMKRNGLF